MPQFSSIFGKLTLCKVAEKPKPVKFAALPQAAPAAVAPKKDDKKAAAPKATSAAAAPSANVEAEIKAVGDEIRILKEKLKAEGLSGKKINDHDEIKTLVAKLTTLKSQGGDGATSSSAAPAPKSPKGSPKAAPAAAPAAGGVDEAAVKAVGDEIRVLKEKLKGEGLSGKKINDHDEVKALVAKLQALKEGGAAAPAAAKPKSPKGSPKAAPAAAPAGGDAEAQVKAVGDEIRLLKEKLKADGLSGKKINDHDEVKALVGKLTELKKQLA